jgi:hypothetical protein
MCPAFKMKDGSEVRRVIVNPVPHGNKFRIQLYHKTRSAHGSVFRILDIYVRIPIRIWLRILLFSSVTFKTFKKFLIITF